MQHDPISNLDIPEDSSATPPSDAWDVPADAVPMNPNDVEDGYAVARLCYLFNFAILPFCLIPYVRRDNAYTLFHAKQALALWIGLVGVGMLGQLLLAVQLGLWIWLGGFPVLWILNWSGLRQVQDEFARPLPLFGLHPQDWFPARMEEEED
jgi:hypothetical protein